LLFFFFVLPIPDRECSFFSPFLFVSVRVALVAFLTRPTLPSALQPHTRTRSSLFYVPFAGCCDTLKNSSFPDLLPLWPCVSFSQCPFPFDGLKTKYHGPPVPHTMSPPARPSSLFFSPLSSLFKSHHVYFPLFLSGPPFAPIYDPAFLQFFSPQDVKVISLSSRLKFFPSRSVYFLSPLLEWFPRWYPFFAFDDIR